MIAASSAPNESLIDEMRRQIGSDGHHISRNPDVTIDLLAELLPIRECYVARRREIPGDLTAAIASLFGFLKAMRLGDGHLGRFNGQGPPRGDLLATVLALDPTPEAPIGSVQVSGYARLERGQTILLADCGPAPPLEFAGKAQAGCLSFELSDGPVAVLTNAGSPHAGHDRDRAAARATASHSTLCLDQTSSGRLITSVHLDRLIKSSAVSGPETVTANLFEDQGGWSLEASHDGYERTYSLTHTRRLRLSPDGRRIEGLDRLAPRSGRPSGTAQHSYAIHFHLAPNIRATRDPAGGGLLITVPGGDRWRLTSEGVEATIEVARRHAHSLGPQPTRQIVLRGLCKGEVTVRWTLAAESSG